MSELKPCPFCGSSFVEISRYGNSKVSTFYQCNDCGVSLETSETFNHGERWNNRPLENKIKADAVKEAILNCEAFWSDNLGTDVFRVSDIDDCVEKFEKGDVV